MELNELPIKLFRSSWKRKQIIKAENERRKRKRKESKETLVASFWSLGKTIVISNLKVNKIATNWIILIKISHFPNSSGVNSLVRINKKQNEIKDAKPIPADNVITFLKKEDGIILSKYEEVPFIINFLINLLNYLLDSSKKKHLHDYSLKLFLKNLIPIPNENKIVNAYR